MEVARCPVPVDTYAPGGATNAYVLGSRPAVLVDPAGRTADLDRLVREGEIAHIVLTHTHPDHVGAVADYAAETGATVWARRGRTAQFAAATGIEPDRCYDSGTRLPLGDDAVTLLETPGHAPEHTAVVAGEGGPVLCGDCAVREGSVVVGAPEGDMRAYLSTLRRLWATNPPRLYPGHGPVIDDPRGTCERLIAHRLERERRIEAAVDGGARTLEAVLDAAYEKDLAGVRDLARATVVAHLEKLAVEGAVGWDPARETVAPR
ncbi:MBL fold metallo-hydrolase [Natrononativus amylolyticus]|uniref:MBL fold metallo-hydrolase n=1 Tax=Natrononativus amylolyticus TaxID=2963434 RepID=UPI0020CD4860|nr:MBL fold metallo-hydrolase [Natrononativus amylolyticus]